jgi:sulfopyruvate decarboxylase TPP-binding subunit
MSENARKTTQTGAQLVVRALEAQGVTHVFGVPGAKIDAVFDELVDSKIKTVVCRHEQNAAFIAGGIGRMTGKAGVAIATSGPGVSNLTTGLATANTEGDPVVALGGAVATDEALKQIHQTMDAVSILRPVTKYSVAVGAPDQVSEVMGNAFRAAESGRPGATYVNLPKDVMAAACAHDPLSLPAFAGLGPADGKAIQEAARLINAASNPVVLVGMLASRPANAEALQSFLAKGNLAVVGTFQAAGAVGALLFDNFGGRVGQLANQPGDRLLDAADLVISVGYDPVEYWPPEWNANNRRKVIHIDVLPADSLLDPTTTAFSYRMCWRRARKWRDASGFARAECWLSSYGGLLSFLDLPHALQLIETPPQAERRWPKHQLTESGQFRSIQVSLRLQWGDPILSIAAPRHPSTAQWRPRYRRISSGRRYRKAKADCDLQSSLDGYPTREPRLAPPRSPAQPLR